MVKDSAQRLNNWLDCAAIDGKDAKDSARTQAKARNDKAAELASNMGIKAANIFSHYTLRAKTEKEIAAMIQ